MDIPDADFDLRYELPEQPVYVNADRNRMRLCGGMDMRNKKKV